MNKAETIEKILIAATREIHLKGVDRASISAIADEAQVTKQLVYHYFKSKDQLCISILEAAAKGMRLSKNVAIYREMNPDDAICRMIDLIFTGFANNPGYAVLALDQAIHRGEHMSRANDFTESMRAFISDTFVEVLQRGEQQGIFRANLDANITFWMIFNLVASCFLNEHMMSQITHIDFQSESGSALWHQGAKDFILNSIRV